MNIKHLLGLLNVARDWRLFVAMIKDKRYKIPFIRKVVYAILIIYIVLPLDFIPDMIPLVGIVDDLGAFAVILGVTLYEISNYRDFREQEERERPVHPSDNKKRIAREAGLREGPLKSEKRSRPSDPSS